MIDINLLYTMAGIQDNLLQSYRNFQLTIQSIFIAVGTGLTIANILTNDYVSNILILVLFVSVAILSIFSLIKIRKVILTRGKDVNYWHKKIITAEKSFDNNNKHLTTFKVYQKHQRTTIKEIEFEDIILNDEIIENLTDKGKYHTRNLIDNILFTGFIMIWIVFFIISIIKTAIIL